MAYRQKLLEQYQLPADCPNVKILVSYIQPSFLFKNDILFPLHLGREVAHESFIDGSRISETDYRYLCENMAGDNDFEGNISYLNRRVGFLTGIYWAYKNYEKLGNPDYFGSFSYRRLLSSEFLPCLRHYDMILPKMRTFDCNLRHEYIASHGNGAYQALVAAVEKLYPQQTDDLNNYFERNSGYFYEIYVLKKNVFFDFCEWIFPLLFELIKKCATQIKIDTHDKALILQHFSKHFAGQICNEQNFEEYQKRDLAFLVERLTGFYLFEQSKKLKYMEVERIFADEDQQLQKRRNEIIRIIQERRRKIQ